MIPHNRAALTDKDGRPTRDWYDWFRRLGEVFEPLNGGAGLLASKQDKLVSTGNIKSINGQSLLGGGDLSITIDSASSALSAAVGLAVTSTWYDGPSVTLDAGTWLITATASFSRSTAVATVWEARLNNGTTSYASGNTFTPAVANNAASISLSAVVTLTASTTVKLQATTNAGATAAQMRDTTLNGGIDKATHINAIKIA